MFIDKRYLKFLNGSTRTTDYNFIRILFTKDIAQLHLAISKIQFSAHTATMAVCSFISYARILLTMVDLNEMKYF